MSLGQGSAPLGRHRPGRVGLVAWSSLFVIMVAPFVSAGQPYRDVLGLRPGMPERDVQARMERLGKRTGGESEEGEGRRETWLLRDRRFASITLEFDSDHNSVIIKGGQAVSAAQDAQPPVASVQPAAAVTPAAHDPNTLQEVVVTGTLIHGVLDAIAPVVAHVRVAT